MDVLLDIGNSRLKWAWLSQGELSGAAVAGHRDRAIDSVVAEIRDYEWHPPEHVIVASVTGPELTNRLVDIFVRGTAAQLVIARSEAHALGVRSGYREPAQLGVDRWMGLLAARAIHSGAICVVQAGTAVTIDALAPDGQHEGGLIVPGLKLMTDALAGGTHRLGSAEPEFAAGVSAVGFAGDTATAIRLGPLVAMRSLVQHCVSDVASRHGAVTVVLTGGSAPALIAVLDVPALHRPMLVLEGLARRYGAPAAAEGRSDSPRP
jgi:type III pantothenate kinase